MNRIIYRFKFFDTKDAAKAFQKTNGGVLYSNAPRSHSKQDYYIELQMARGAGLSIDPEQTPYVVAWNERIA